VVRALEMARSRSMHTVALTGGSGGVLASVADRTICIPSYETPRIQECHILAGHIICEIVECMISENLEPEVATSSGTRIVPEFNESLS
jgi:DNA-binding MurR/RpiR family transcriptional regulator